MAIDTYAKLQSEILDTLNRTDLVATITTYSPGSVEGAVQRGIRRGELRMQRELVFRELQESSSFSITSSVASYTLPTDFGSFNFAYILGGTVAVLQSKMIATLYSDDTSTGVGRPDSICIYGSNFILRPYPDGSYEMPFYYNKKIAALTDTNTSNIILTNYPDMYLYSALLELTAHLSEDERIVVWKGYYDEGKRVINQETTTAWTGSLGRANINLSLVV